MFFLFVTLFSSGCTINENNRQYAFTDEAEQEPVVAEVLRIGVENFNINALPWTDLDSSWCWKSVYDTLLTMDPANPDIIKGCLAEEWNHSDDYLVWTFRLKEGVSFSDGTVCNAYALAECYDIYSKNFYNEFVSCNVVSWEPVSEYELQFVLSAVCPWFERDMCRVMTCAVSPTALKIYGAYDSRASIGTGIYVVNRSAAKEHKDMLVLDAVKNHHSRNEEIVATRLVITFAGYETQKKLEHLINGQLDAVYVYFNAETAFENLSAYEVNGVVLKCFHAQSQAIWFNSQMYKPFEIYEVRRAISLLIDLERFNNELYQSMGKVQSSIWADNCVSYVEFVGNGYDPQKATSLLADVGFDLAELSFNIKDNYRDALGKQLEIQLGELGVQLKVETRDLTGVQMWYPNGSAINIPLSLGCDYMVSRGSYSSLNRSTMGPHAAWLGIMQPYDGTDLEWFLPSLYIEHPNSMYKFSWQEIYDPDLYARMCEIYDRMMTTPHWDEMVECSRELTRIVQEDYAALPLVQEPVFFAVREGAEEQFEALTETSMFKWMYQ